MRQKRKSKNRKRGKGYKKVKEIYARNRRKYKSTNRKRKIGIRE